MPKITINERDLTSPGINQSTSNAVFIPGYAITGPINEPTLCNTLEEFQNIFGSLPYVFPVKTYYNGGAQDTTSNTYVFEKGSPERSYIYAAETVKRGLPVIYTRVFDTSEANIKNFTAVGYYPAGSVDDAKVTITSKNVGSAGKYIECSLTPVAAVPTLLLLTVTQQDKVIQGSTTVVTGLKKKEERTYITFTPGDVDKYSNSYKPVLYTDVNLSLVDIAFNVTSMQDLGLEEATTIKLAIPAEEGTAEFNPSTLYNTLNNLLEEISDRGEYSLKFITSGAYPTFQQKTITTNPVIELDQLMATTAMERGDCIAIIDTVPNTSTTAISILEALKTASYGDADVYAAMFVPAGLYDCQTVNKQLVMPASFGYITAYATSIQNNPGWLAVAGAARGVLPNLVSPIGPKITSSVIDELQARDTISINPITLIRPYGNLIWGNRTLKDNSIAQGLTAQSFLNIRCLLSDLKKVIYTTAKGLTFEQNTDILWINFKAGIVPTLEQMVTGGGLSGYEIKRVRTTEKAKVKALIRLYAVEAVEDFDIDIELTDSEITTTE